MKIFIDTAPLATGHAVRGIGSYTRNLVEALKKRKDIKLVDKNPDIVHIPYFDLFFDTLRVRRDVPAVVTIYDVIPLIYPEHYPPGIKGKLRFTRQKRKLRDVAAVITISETSKKDIVRFLDVPQEKIYVTQLAPGSAFRKIDNYTLIRRSVGKYNLPEKFVLYVGDVNYNKNVEGLIKAVSKTDLDLVLVGKAFKDDIPETRKILHLIEELGVTRNVVMPGFVPEEDFVKIYNLATLYCQPSFYEGFGLPVLEAMACGRPIVAAKTQALVEIAEGAAVFVDPEDPEDVASGLKQATDGKKGMEHVKKFYWDKTAEATVEVYKKCLNL